jgi:predicted HTH domain antitoxin
MQVTVQLPDSIARQLTPVGGDIPRRILEAVALEGYRSEQLSRGQVSEMLGLNFWETEAFLKAHGAYLNYSKEDLEQDARSNERVLRK